MADDEYPAADAGESAVEDAGVAEPIVSRLPREPAPYQAPPREEPGPEAMPPAVIEREFQPISDVGAPTGIPEEYPRRAPDEAASDEVSSE